MKPLIVLAQHRAAIRRIVAAHRARNAAGSAPSCMMPTARAATSTFSPNMTLMGIGTILHELLQLLDVVTPKAIREYILAEALPV